MERSRPSRQALLRRTSRRRLGRLTHPTPRGEGPDPRPDSGLHRRRTVRRALVRQVDHGADDLAQHLVALCQRAPASGPGFATRDVGAVKSCHIGKSPCHLRQPGEMLADMNTESPYDFADPALVAAYPQQAARAVPGYHDVHTMVSVLLAERAPEDARVLVLGAGAGSRRRPWRRRIPTGRSSPSTPRQPCSTSP